MEFKFTNVFSFYRKKLLIFFMRAFLFLFCTIAFGFTSNLSFSQNAKVVIDSDKTVTVDEVFDLIKKQTDYTFIYKSDLFVKHPKVFLRKGILRINELLQQSIKTKNYSFTFAGSAITIKKKSNLEIQQLADQKTFPITGLVVDSNGDPIPGAHVYVSNRSSKRGEVNNPNFVVRGTETDFNGKFKLQVSLNHYLKVSAIGYQFHEQQITSEKQAYRIVLKESVNKLDEVVIVGYGKTRRRDLTGSVATVKAKDIENTQPAALSIDQVLGGQLAGVSVAQIDGRPGSGAIVNIRGISSLRGQNQPLYVIDGIPMVVDEVVPSDFALGGNFGGLQEFSQVNPLLALNPSDIESIDVLKDASAAAIYGSRAANGVILITTKKGKRGSRAKFTANMNLSVQSAIKEYEFMNAAQYRDYITTIANTTAAANPGNRTAQIVLNNNRQFGHPTAVTPYFGTGDTNWVRELFRESALSRTVNATYSGGGYRSSYFVSLNLADQNGLNKGNNFKNYSIRSNVETDLGEKVKVGTNISFSRSENKSQGSNSLNYANIFRYQPTFGVRNADGSYTSYTEYRFSPFSPSGIQFNPASDLEKESKAVGQNFIGAAFAEYEIIKGLKYRAAFNVSLLNSESRSYSPIFLTSTFTPDLTLNDSRTINSNWTHTLTYDKVFAEKHTFNGVLGASYENREIGQKAIGVQGFSSDSFNNLGAAKNVIYRYEDKQLGRLNSYFGRFNYDYDKRYYFTLTGRFDGSTKFGANNRWGFFPSAAFMWNIGNEDFLKNNKVISDLRFRSSLGRTGLANLPEFQFQLAYQLNNGFNNNNYNNTAAIVSNGIPNPDLKWEETDQLDLALQFGLFNNMITGSFNYYNNKTKGLLLNTPISPTTGFTTQNFNIADVSNRGFEVEIGGNITFGELTWRPRFNIATNQNRLDKLNGGTLGTFGNPNTVREGAPLGNIYGYVVEGIFQSQQEINDLNAAAGGEYQDPQGMAVGNYKLKDLNGDGKITGADRKILGNALPDFFGGFNNTLTYKNFELTANFQFSHGASKVFADQNNFFQNYGLDANNLVGALDNTWSPTNTNARFEQAIFGSDRRFARERSGGLDTAGELDRNVYSTSYIRLKTLRLAYNFPRVLLDKLNMSHLQLHVNVNNVWTSSDWPGLDPESVTSGSPGTTVTSLNSIFSWDAGPLTRTWSFGINVGF